MSVTISAIIAGGIHACLIAAANSVPDVQGPAMAALQANQVLDQLAAGMEPAVFVSERSATVLPQVEHFSLTPAFETVTETFPGLSVEDGAESLLIDHYSTSGTGDESVSSTTWFGQYFSLTLPADAYAWRPTRVEFMAKKNNIPGVSCLRMRRATLTMTPDSVVQQQAGTLADTALGTIYAFYNANFTNLDPINSGGGTCFVVEYQSGSGPITLQRSSSFPGMLKTTNTDAAHHSRSAESS